MTLLGFRGDAYRINDIDIPRIGAEIGVGEDELHAFMDVEAAGSGFDSKGRPKMLFEPHVFYRNLSGDQRTQAVRAGLAYPSWRINYPADSYPRLERAMAINETAALKAASWGLTQILGENFRDAGYASPHEMVEAFMNDEEEHLLATVKLLRAMRIDDDLRAHNWTAVARGWNGPAHAKHNYAGRMKASFIRWQGIRDTPWDGSVTPVDATPADAESYPVLRVGAGWGKHAQLLPYVKLLQTRLVAHGYADLVVDGKFGGDTKKAVIDFQTERGYKPDGVVGGFETWPALMRDPASADIPVSGIGDTSGQMVTEEVKPVRKDNSLKGVAGRVMLYDDSSPGLWEDLFGIPLNGRT